MLFSAVEQAYIFLGAVYSGFILGLLYDICAWLRKVLRAGMFLSAVVDLLYWAIAFFIIMLTLLVANDGEIRLYIAIGFICGISLYASILSPLFRLCCAAAYRGFSNLYKRAMKMPVISRLLR